MDWTRPRGAGSRLATYFLLEVFPYRTEVVVVEQRVLRRGRGYMLRFVLLVSGVGPGVLRSCGSVRRDGLSARWPGLGCSCFCGRALTVTVIVWSGSLATIWSSFIQSLCFQLYLERSTVTVSFSWLSSDMVASVCVLLWVLTRRTLRSRQRTAVCYCRRYKYRISL